MKKYKNILILIITNILIILISSKTNIFGSTMDFLNQHIIFPEYLRNTFYETGKIIPKLLINIGAGQNIYNIAYYGLLNPIILLSYLFPFIKMIDYLIIVNIILLFLSNILFYKFIKTKFNENISLTLTLLFTLSGSLIFHFHRHFMFVNYIPFLILGLINIEKNKKINLIIDIFLIITTSFYYSIPSIISLLIYYIYINFNKFKIKEFIKIIGCILISIISSSILLLPTLNALLTTRTSINSINLLELLIPNINIDNLLYGSYSPGLTSILIISLIYLIITKKKQDKFLLITISILSFIPLSLYLLNGGLYLRSKALIPLLPLLVYIIGIFINDLINNKINIKKLLLTTILINLIILIKYQVLIYYLDLVFMILLILIYNKTKIKNILLIPLIILNIVTCICFNQNETYISKNYYNEVSKQENYIETNYRTTNMNNNDQTINKTYGNNYYSPNIYSSTINKYYKNLYHNTFKINNPNINNLMISATDNILFNKYLGIKYIISDTNLEYPYKKINNNLYELDVLPIGYVTTNTVNKEYYSNIEYPYNLDILLNNIIDDKSNNKPTSNVKKINLEYTCEIGKNINIKKENNNYKIEVLEDDIIKINLKENLKNKILFINIYGLKENKKDIKITINNQTNLLTKQNWIYPNNNNTFNYSLNNVEDKLEIKLTKGIYDIENIETYILDKNDITLNKVDELKINKINTETIKGNINVTEDGYFIIKIPYDEGFKIKVNNELKEYKLLNETFMGFFLEKGYYEIEITYTPKLFKEGKFLSIIGISIFIIITIYSKKHLNKN